MNQDDSFSDFMQESQKSLQEIQEVYEQKESEFELLKLKIEEKIRLNADSGMLFLDSLLAVRRDLTNSKKSQLLLHSCDVLYQSGKYDLSLSQSMKLDSVAKKPRPDNLSYKARCFIKLGHMKDAEAALMEADSINWVYGWLLGNYYEIYQDSSKAIECYINLYKKDKNYYSFCKERIDSLRNGAVFFHDLDFTRINNEPVIIF